MLTTVSIARRCFQTILLLHVVLQLQPVLSQQQRISSHPHQRLNKQQQQQQQQQHYITTTAFQNFHHNIGRPNNNNYFHFCFSKYNKNFITETNHHVTYSDRLQLPVLNNNNNNNKNKIRNNIQTTFFRFRVLHMKSLSSTSTTESSEYHNDTNTKEQQKQRTVRGDAIRELTGIRPSLHPITINAIADGLKLFVNMLSSSTSSNTTTGTLPITPIDIVQWANSIGTKTIIKRQQTSNNDGMKLTVDEQQVILGRIIGVFIRLYSLDTLLYTKCTNVTWISKYNEYNTFGIIPITSSTTDETNNRTITSTCKDATTSLLRLYIQNDILLNKIRTEPLFVINKAECLLSLFIHTIEKPQLQANNISLCDNSIIDFLDDDRQQVLLS